MAKPAKNLGQSKTTKRQWAGTGVVSGLAAAILAVWNSFSPETAPNLETVVVIMGAVSTGLGPLLSRWFSSKGKD